MTENSEQQFSMERRECEHCGACWLNGVHYWKTGVTSDSSELDLAGLVCNTKYGNPSKCINPQRGELGGDSWEKRMGYLQRLEEEKDR